MTPRFEEFALIESLRRRGLTDPRVAVGIGDDAAVLARGERDLLVTVDMLLEGVHFDLSLTSPWQVGRKAIGVNLSDIAAMAGEPVAAFVALGLPDGSTSAMADELMEGIASHGSEFGVVLAGGDTNRSKSGLVVALTLLGRPTGRGPVLRSGARPGDVLCVTGSLGGSLAGRHWSFPPRVREAQQLHESVELHAMIDVSDGIGSDIFHLARASGCGFVIDADAVPISESLPVDAKSQLDHALNDGEDFELLFAIPRESSARLLKSPPFAEPPITVIGEAIAESGVFLRRGETKVSLEPGGYVHSW